MEQRPRKGFVRWLKRLAAWPLALVILFEEWGWEPLQRGLARLGRALGLAWLEAAIGRLPPYAALAVLLLPSLLLLPVKLSALWLIGRSQAMAELAAPEHDLGALEADVRVAQARSVRKRVSIYRGEGGPADGQAEGEP